MHAQNSVLRQAEIQQQTPAMPVFGNVGNAQFLSPAHVDIGYVMAFKTDCA